MIFRAIFWIGLVAILMPHEPDLGFGRPAAPSLDANVASDVASWAGTKLKEPGNICRDNAGACSVGASLIDNVRAATLRSLAEVKADIRQNGRKTVLTH
jgi:hypothetical protein